MVFTRRDLYAKRDVDENPDFDTIARSPLSVNILAPISPDEILSALKDPHNCGSAPGGSNISYSDLLNVDFNGDLLSESWKHSHSILIFKSGDKDDISNWRPITLSECIYRLLMKILSKRMRAAIESHNLISSWQRGFLSFNGCSDHNLMVQSCLDSVRVSNKELNLSGNNFAL